MEKNSGSGSNIGVIRMTAEVVAAYVGNNSVPAAHLADLIGSVYVSLAGLDHPVEEQRSEPAKPAISIKKSITPEYLICLEDGKKLKMLKRHLRSTYGLTPDQYRAKWGLPPDYPMVAPNYAAQRSAFAKQIGLGRAGGKAAARRGRK